MERIKPKEALFYLSCFLAASAIYGGAGYLSQWLPRLLVEGLSLLAVGIGLVGFWEFTPEAQRAEGVSRLIFNLIAVALGYMAYEAFSVAFAAEGAFERFSMFALGCWLSFGALFLVFRLREK